jgi:hypothetical protein
MKDIKSNKKNKKILLFLGLPFLIIVLLAVAFWIYGTFENNHGIEYDKKQYIKFAQPAYLHLTSVQSSSAFGDDAPTVSYFYSFQTQEMQVFNYERDLFRSQGYQISDDYPLNNVSGGQSSFDASNNTAKIYSEVSLTPNTIELDMIEQ